jgi:uridine phosphorylase
MTVFPLQEDYQETPVNTPGDTVKLMAKKRGLAIEEIQVPKIVFLSLSAGATEPLVRITQANEKKWIYRARPLFVGRAGDLPAAVIWAAPGAPLTAMVMEDMIACGAEVFIGIGLASAIQPSVEEGDLILPSVAVRDEGTSFHYLSRDCPAAPTKGLLDDLSEACQKSGLKYHVGPVWSTDTPYRETPSKLDYYRKNGVLGVDMETSTIFSVASYRGVKSGCVLVVSSNLSSRKHGIGFYGEGLSSSIVPAVSCLIEAVKEASRRI